MLNSNSCFQPNREEVASKVMDGEAILINLITGVYYSMDKVGGAVWDLIEGGCNLGEITENIVARYDVNLERAQSDIELLAEELLQEKLVLESNHDTAQSDKKEVSYSEKLPYESPKLNIYRDMGDLLALDPPTPGLEKLP